MPKQPRKAFATNALDTIKKNNKKNGVKGIANRLDNLLYRDSFELHAQKPGWKASDSYRKGDKSKDKAGGSNFRGPTNWEDLGKTDHKFQAKFNDIQSALNSFDKSSIPKGAKNNNNHGSTGDGGVNGTINSTTKATNNMNPNISENNSTSAGSRYPTGVNNYNSTNSTNYSNYTGSGSGGNSGSGGRPSSGGRGNGGSSTTALGARKSGGGGSSSRWYGLNEFTNSSINYASRVPTGMILNPNPDTYYGHSPAYINCGLFFENYTYRWHVLNDPGTSVVRDVNTVAKNYYSEVLNQDVYYAYLHQIEKVRNRNVGKYFTKLSFTKYMDSVIHGLQIYYCLDSILAYDTDANQYNSAMSNLRERISTDVVSEFTNLRRCLERQVMKPEMVNFIRFMFQTFAAHDGKQAPIMKVSYYDMLATDTKIDHLQDPIMIRTIIDQIQTDFTDAFNYISGGYPEYALIGKLPPSTSKAIVSTDFNTWWHNMDVSYPMCDNAGAIVSVQHSKEETDEDSLSHYGVFGDDMDGMLYAASSIFIDTMSENGGYQTGMFRPLFETLDFTDVDKMSAGSLKYYETKSKKFLGSKMNPSVGPNAMIYRSWTEKFSGGEMIPTVHAHIPVGCQRVLAHSVRMLQQSVFEGVRTLIHP